MANLVLDKDLLGYFWNKIKLRFATKDQLGTHTNNLEIHVTKEKTDAWDAKASEAAGIVGVTPGTGIDVVSSSTSPTVSHKSHTGDVTGTTTLTIANDVVTNSKLANMGAFTFKGNPTNASADPQDMNQSTTLNALFIATINTKTMPIDADSLIISDSTNGNVARRTTWAEIKAVLKTYFDKVYTKSSGSVSVPGSIAFPNNTIVTTYTDGSNLTISFGTNTVIETYKNSTGTIIRTATTTFNSDGSMTIV